MPNMHIWCPIYFGHKVVDNANCADNAFYAGALQCHLCRQCQLCAWDTVFLKLNFHPVNFHFMHIWHCLWHFFGLKYASLLLKVSYSRFWPFGFKHEAISLYANFIVGSLYGGSYMDSLKLSKCTQECGERAGKILLFLPISLHVNYICLGVW